MDPARLRHAPAPDRWRIYRDLGRLLSQDLANVEAGLYPLPRDHDGTLLTSLRRSRLFFEDLPAIHRRRERNAYREVLTEATAGKRPEYYLQNFHYQSGGWLTKDSADRYDTQVEVLFKGSANAMRRQALPPLHEIVAGAISVDCGCSTSPVARAGFSTSSNRHGRGFPSSGSIYRRPTAAMPGATSAAGLASISSSATRSRSRRRTAASTRRRAFSPFTNCRRKRAGMPSGNAPAFSSRADASCCSIRCSAGMCRITTECSKIPAQLSRAVLRQLYRRGFLGGCAAIRTDAQARHNGVRVESDGVRQATQSLTVASGH